MDKFLQPVKRNNTRSVKWDWTEKLFNYKDVLPMWVADMDFPTADAVQEAIMNRAKHNVYGYTAADDQLTNTITYWLLKRHNWSVDPRTILFSPGVVTSLNIIVNTLTKEGDQVMIQTPVYHPFYEAVEKHNRKLIKNSLIRKQEKYVIDFDDFEQKLKDGVKLFILCSPHNPVGRVWSTEELRRMGELCVSYGVIIVADEIHADLIYKPHVHKPMATISNEIADHTITCMSPSKTFNLAGLQASYIITHNRAWKLKLKRTFHKFGLHLLNPFGIVAMEAAYEKGEPWLNGLLNQLEQNKSYTINVLKQETDRIKVIEPEGTYLLWFDCRGLGMDQKELKRFMQEEARVGLNDGIQFGQEGSGFMRMNIACPPPTLEEGLKRITTTVKQL
ncbi:MalY/PatB family protein [Salirhabdus salicampi]|uniref:MalY/PatB family protein n=1 Tax=Salirhabdus salicampi TaxID=476102 RepID=UPI0020C57A7B|nr:PatB family C-S lyase [Salirhabdus salicampi]MCP8617776.1 PatB family C-S lyase [Salirhabdus salicampi]